MGGSHQTLGAQPMTVPTLPASTGFLSHASAVCGRSPGGLSGGCSYLTSSISNSFLWLLTTGRLDRGADIATFHRKHHNCLDQCCRIILSPDSCHPPSTVTTLPANSIRHDPFACSLRFCRLRKRGAIVKF